MYDQIKISAIREVLARITPGEWKDEIGYGGYLHVQSQVRPDDSSPFIVCGVGDMEDTVPEDYANAKFIAAAPGYVLYLLKVVAELNGDTWHDIAPAPPYDPPETDVYEHWDGTCYNCTDKVFMIEVDDGYYVCPVCGDEHDTSDEDQDIP